MNLTLSTINKNQNLADYIYLLRVLNFSKIGLIELFKNPEMTISSFKNLNKERIQHFLLRGKQIKFDDYSKINNILNFDYSDQDFLKIEEMVKFCSQHSIHIITGYSAKIPLIFFDLDKKTRDLVFIKGKVLNQDLKSYSICGTRNPTEDAIKKTRLIAEYFAKKSYTLINGFAKGIDIEGFIGASKVNGRYLGIIASGVENIYPPENNKYISKVVTNGAFISQRLIWKRVTKKTLQLRNRFSALLSNGSIFIEGDYKSGTKWQYKFAKEAKKPVFYLEPKDWSHENSHIPKLIKKQGGIEIRNDLSNLDDINLILLDYYSKRVKKISEFAKINTI
ncbi:DNA-processing protein DprA [Candidatus Harpocratesius sp.]